MTGKRGPLLDAVDIVALSILVIVGGGLILGHVAFHADNPTIEVSVTDLPDKEIGPKIAVAAKDACDNGLVHWVVGKPSRVTVNVTSNAAVLRQEHIDCDLYRSDE